MITQTFGDMLYYPQSECLTEFPSPESLKHRIIISTKPPKEFLESKNLKDKGIILPNGKESFEEETSEKYSLDLKVEFEDDDRVSRKQNLSPVELVSVFCCFFYNIYSNKYRVTAIKMTKTTMSVIVNQSRQRHPSTNA